MEAGPSDLIGLQDDAEVCRPACVMRLRRVSGRVYLMNPKKLFQKALQRPKNLASHDLLNLARAFAFELSRVSGSHRVRVHPRMDRP